MQWDICMDWGLFQFTRAGRVIPRQRMMLPTYCYVLASMINLVLRFSWAANRIPQLANLHSSHLVLMVEMGEICRRSMWNILRIEWEVIVQQERASANKDTDLEIDVELTKQIVKAANGNSPP
jgi:EXS family